MNSAVKLLNNFGKAQSAYSRLHHILRASYSMVSSSRYTNPEQVPSCSNLAIMVQPVRLMSESVSISERIDALVKESKVVIFMKGVPAAPQCGFSNAVVQIMRMHDVTFESHNVLADEELRQGIKDFSNWPTIPQVYFEGEFIGGCDILLQMHQNGELIEELEKIGIKSALLEDKK